MCLHFLPYLLNICRKFEFSISQDSVSNMPKVRWVVWIKLPRILDIHCTKSGEQEALLLQRNRATRYVS